MPKTFLMTVLLASTALALPLSRAQAQATATATPAPSRTTAEDVIVVTGVEKKAAGGGLIKREVMAKSVSTVSSAFIRSQSAIQNVYQYVQLTPGALVSTTDPYGLNEQYSLNVHGLGQDELGYVLEGMPLNDIGYYSAYPAQFIDSENIDEIQLEQGTADLDSPVISAAGGLMNITMLDPSLRPGGLADVSVGTYATNRVFLRLDSGLIGATDTRAFISYSRTSSDNWHGPGRGRRQHIDFKVVREWGDGNRATLTGTYHDAITPLYINPTLDQFQQTGVHTNYDSQFTPGDTNFYGLHIGTFRIMYLSAPARLHIADHLTWNVTPYWQYGFGNGPYGATLTEDGNNQGDGDYTGSGPYTFLGQGAYVNNTYHINIPNYAATGGTVMANYTDLQYRAGVVSKLTYSTGPNDFIVGGWYDYSDETDTQSYSAISSSGFPADIWGDQTGQFLRLPNGQLFLAGEDHVITQTVEPFVADILHLLDDKMTIEVGFKEAFVARDGTNGVPGPQYHANIANHEPLPRAAIRYQINPENQVFANVSTNFRTPSEATFFDGYYGNYIYYQANTNLKPEYSTSEDVGYRYTGPLITASATAFNFFFTNRQVSTLFGGSMINQSVNAGSQTTYGVDLEAGTRPWRHFSPYVSGEWLHSVDDNNFLVGTTFLPTAGKTAVRSPQYEAAVGLNYDNGSFFANFNAKFVDTQYSTFMNDEKIPAYITANLGVGARLPSYGLKTGPELKLNIINLTGRNYLASVASPTPNAQTQTALDGSQIAGSPPSYYLSGGFAVMFTATQAF